MSIMESEKYVGVHVLVNVYDVPNEDLLVYLSNGLPILKDIVSKLQLNVVSETGFQFSPIGYSYAFVLSESHFTIHTYPEYKSCYIDVFCCNSEFNPETTVEIIKNAFNTTNVKYQVVRR